MGCPARLYKQIFNSNDFRSKAVTAYPEKRGHTSQIWITLFYRIYALK